MRPDMKQKALLVGGHEGGRRHGWLGGKVAERFEAPPLWQPVGRTVNQQVDILLMKQAALKVRSYNDLKII